MARELSRGEIWLLEMPRPDKRRPVLVLSRPSLIALLHTGISVVLDMPANTPAVRNWIRGIIERAGVAHQLHYLDVPTEVCRERLWAREEEGTHVFRANDQVFDAQVKGFVPPGPEEGFEVIVHRFEPDSSL